MHRGGTFEEINLAVGMEVMVTYRLDTVLDVAGGARGVIVDIVLDEEEPPNDPNLSEVRLRCVTTCLLIKLTT